ncbi:hypothetical protein [Methylobacterium sp. J-077]|uniref:hypothetical protein n=1 Tax=Methylobacterium sp. J-077 TaxID=2836656 RepID=UPI001FB93701|nr:hypothetical protein [Methylobacterium sp. J-077]MCJ2125106.1 hypothetical protein [Methylobacterium sp. J-077]
MQKVGTTIALELIGPAERFTSWIEDIVSDKRKEGIDALRNGMREIGTELGKIPWKEAGESAKEMLLSTTALVKPMAEGVREVAAAIRSFNEGKYLETFRHLDGGSGPLARKLAPLPGDEVLNKQDRLDQIKGQLQNFEASEKSGTANERSREQADKLRREMEKLTEEIRALRQKDNSGATTQKSSAEGEGPFAGATIQSAAFMGGGGFRRMPSIGGNANLPGGGSGPGYSGEQSERNAMREQFREHLKRTVPGYDGGATVPIAPGTKFPEMGGAGRLRGIGGGRGSMPGIPDNVPMTAEERNTLGLIMKYESHGQNTMNYEGKRQGLDPLTAKGYTAQGYYQMLNSNWRRIAPGLGIKAPNAMSGSLEEQTRVALHLLRNGGIRNWSNYNPALRGALARREQAPVASIQNIPQIGERPRISSNDPDFLPSGAPTVLKPNSMKDAPGLTMDEANRLRGGQADGDGWAAREKARKEFEAKIQQGEGRLDRSAGRAGVMGGAKVDASGSVVVNVAKPGPDTQVRTSTAGNLFKDVVLRRGRPMASGDST